MRNVPTNPRPRFRLRLAASLLAMVLAFACTRDATSADGLPPGLAPGLYAVIRLAPSGPDALRAELYLERVGVPVAPAGYQGEITWDAGALALDAAQLPAGAVGSTRGGPGRVRFSAAAWDGVGDGPVLTLSFRRRGPVSREAFAVTFEEVTGTDFTDATGLVSARGPFFVER